MGDKKKNFYDYLCCKIYELEKEKAKLYVNYPVLSFRIKNLNPDNVSLMFDKYNNSNCGFLVTNKSKLALTNYKNCIRIFSSVSNEYSIRGAEVSQTLGYANDVIVNLAPNMLTAGDIKQIREHGELKKFINNVEYHLVFSGARNKELRDKIVDKYINDTVIYEKLRQKEELYNLKIKNIIDVIKDMYCLDDNSIYETINYMKIKRR